ncbi:MAG: hypothetical protein ACYTG5_08255 [Planctomycetota bacterium]|jgi:hypothetical protein
MTKSTPKSEPQPGPATTTSSREDVQVAYQCHTLAQLVFAQLATAYPWLSQPSPPVGTRPWQQPKQWPVNPQ